MRKLERFENLVAMFFARAREQGDKPFLWRKEKGQWVSQSWAETARQVASLAAGLKALGLKPGDRVMLVSENRPEWCVSDLAIMAAGCITVPTYTTNTERDHHHIIENSGACAIIVSTEKLAKTLLQPPQHLAHEPRAAIDQRTVDLHQRSTGIEPRLRLVGAADPADRDQRQPPA